jgi:protein-tyrosine phosphatase
VWAFPTCASACSGLWGHERVRDIFWIEGEGAPHLAIVMRPHGDDLLQDELCRIRDGGIDTLVSLLEPFEARMLGLAKEEPLARAAGIEFLSFPIPDTQVPEDEAAFRRFARGIAQRLQRGEHVGVHCRGCIGRATITAACALAHLGWEPRRALEAIERARGASVPDTPVQEEWILRYKAEP